MSASAPTSERVRRMAGELADLLKESERPNATLAEFVSVMSTEHGVDVRKARTFEELWNEGLTWTDEQVRAYLDRRKAAFTRADAEEFLRTDEKYVSGEQLLAELDAINREYAERNQPRDARE